ncbi:sigma 54-interacting transcriptional regulator [Niallia sp. XMNu-256]|uniref:sigma-54 interaction domain-containing protein n=1 Tax=Niallia sp. XMNu-256 TaxID=3082444 RepID=UPI0030D5F532
MSKNGSISNEVLAAILQSIDEGIHAVNLAGETIFYNSIAAEHDGLTVEEVLGKSILDIFPSLTSQSSTLLKVIKSQKPIYNQPQTYVNLHGDKVDTINTTLPIFIDKELVGAVEIAKDYTRLKMLSEKLVDVQRKIKLSKENPKPSILNTISYRFSDLKTIDPTFIKLKRNAEKLAKSDSPMLVIGESGTGKELFVQGVHHASIRSEGPFIAQNCAAIPESLLESLLFGTVKGSFTGAVDRPGLFELADEGTLFLDEIHAMPIELQAKLLRVLEDGLVRRVGSTKTVSTNVRVIGAMNISPTRALEEKKMRSDLFYRLNVLTFELPPLRERREDIQYLTDYFIEGFNIKLHKTIKGVDSHVQGIFHSYSWPGNVRELKNTIEYMMNICEEEVLRENHLPIMLLKKVEKSTDFLQKDLSLREYLTNFEHQLIEKAMERANGNIRQAAKLLQVPRQTLQYKLKKQDAEKMAGEGYGR